MEDLARTVSIIMSFPLLIAPILFSTVRMSKNRWVTILAIPLSLVSAIFGLILLLSEIGVVARAFGLWGVLFSLATWRIIWKRYTDKKNLDE
jgi:drug/metabolite transporter superfamily protein YnfA